MQDIVLCSQLTSRHGLLVGLTETKKTVTLIYEQSVDRNSAFEMLQKPKWLNLKKMPNKQNLQNSKPRNSDL